MGVAAVLLLVIFFWFFLLRRSYKKLRKGQPRRSRFKPDYDLSDPCAKRRVRQPSAVIAAAES